MAAGRTTTTRKPPARKPAVTAKGRTTRKSPAKPTQRRPTTTNRRPPKRTQERGGWLQRVLLACAALAVIGAMVGVVVGTQRSHRVGDATIVLDVRTAEEFAAGHLEDAIHLDANAPDFEDRAAAFSPASALIVYCRSGARAQVVVDRLEALGFEDVTNAGSLHGASWTTGLDIVQQ